MDERKRERNVGIHWPCCNKVPLESSVIKFAGCLKDGATVMVLHKNGVYNFSIYFGIFGE